MSYFNNFISKFSDNSLAISVLPVPVGPKNKKLATGLLPCLIPEKLTYIRSRTSLITVSCPYSLSLIFDSKFLILSLCSFLSLSTGTFANFETSTIILLLSIIAPVSFFARSLAHAASTTSIDLSGFFLSVIYLAVISTAATSASSLISTSWNASNLLATPASIFPVLSRSGSSTVTLKNLRIRARSFSNDS